MGKLIGIDANTNVSPLYTGFAEENARIARQLPAVDADQIEIPHSFSVDDTDHEAGVDKSITPFVSGAPNVIDARVVITEGFIVPSIGSSMCSFP